jgi:hypothetical protein
MSMVKRSRLSRSLRRLPVTEIGGRDFFVDFRLGELRAVDNPHVRRPMPVELWSEKR